jgi:hypothetical protein
MTIALRTRPFRLLGYRFVRGIFNERTLDESADLYLAVIPTKPVATGHEVESRQVVELSMLIGITRDDVTNIAESKIEETLFGPNTVLATKCVAGYVAKEVVYDRDLSKFDEMLQHAVEQLYQVVRSKAIIIAGDSGFDATDIPVEVDVESLFKHVRSDEAPRSAKAVKKGRSP